MRILVVKYMDEKKKVTIPDGATVTFGPSIPGPMAKSRDQYGGYQPREMEYALRIYEGGSAKTPLIGVLTGVRSFHIQEIKVDYNPADQDESVMEPR